MELANGYRELGDPDEQRERLLRDHSLRRKRGQPLPSFDERLLAALPSMPDCAGVALGMDRLLQCLLDADRLADVVAIGFDRA